MNSNIKIIIIAIIAVLAGLSVGYLIFANTPEEHLHESADSNDTSVSEDQIWTCSMHPQIRQNEPGLCPICEMDLIPLETNTSNDPLVLEMTPEAVKLANIQTTIVGTEGGSSEKTIRLSGKVKEDERLAASLVTHISGRIEQLYVTFEGEYVQKGQAIARIYSPELILMQKEIQEARKIKDSNPHLLTAAINKLRFSKISKKTVDMILASDTIYETVDIYAHHSGVVSQKRVTVGDHLNIGTILFDIQNLNKVWVLFDAYEEDLSSISIGALVEFTTPAVPNKTFKSRITFIDPVIDPQTRVASLRTEVSNPGGLLKPEMFVSGVLQNKISKDAKLTIPKSAVLWTGTRSVVYVKIPDTTIPSYQFREVELGESLGNAYQVVSGLEAGEEVVTYGSFTIDAAAQLNNQASMMNKDVLISNSEQQAAQPDFTASTPDTFKEQLDGVVQAYLSLKDALVATAPIEAKAAAVEVGEKIKNVDMTLVKGEAHQYWMDQLKALQGHSKKIAETDEVEVQRQQFDFLSQALINTVKAFGIPEDTLYVQHCPMAFDNAGADWISDAEAIRNPYFGDKMLKCGLVKESITKDFKNPPTE